MASPRQRHALDWTISIMSLPALKTSTSGDNGFPLMMKAWRQRRRLSQLELALSSGVSQRYVSFLESGRAKPSRSMIRGDRSWYRAQREAEAFGGLEMKQVLTELSQYRDAEML